MKQFSYTLIISISHLFICYVDALAASAEKSVIRVNTTMQTFNLIQPWEKGAASTRLGLGAVLPNNKVLVTAQMVTDATYIELEKPDSSEKTTAKVLTVDYEANLALLEPSNDKDFLSDREPVSYTHLTLPTKRIV